MQEIESQPRTWAQALDMAIAQRSTLAVPGERVLAIGCGTSAFMARSYAALREQAGLGETDWAYAPEAPIGRRYDRVVAISRSGTTTEVLESLSSLPPRTRRVAVTAVSGKPIDDLTDDRVLLDFADETSVVHTRFPTTFLALVRAALGLPVDHLVRDAEAALAAPLPVDIRDYNHFAYLGTGWTTGLAHEAALKIREAALKIREAALKIREAAQAWSESYLGLDYRHGPVAVAGRRSLVWIFGPEPAGLAASVGESGATMHVGALDPLAELVIAQRLAVALAAERGLDPDHPRLLTRSVVLSGMAVLPPTFAHVFANHSTVAPTAPSPGASL